ncbi:MAG: putative glycoside hydrolase [Opitutaceae bacterium]
MPPFAAAYRFAPNFCVRSLAAALALASGLLFAGARVRARVSALKPDFPKLATIEIGDKRYDHPKFQAMIAKYDLAVIGFYKGWEGGPPSMRAAVRAIKARNPAILLANYTLLESNYWNLKQRDAFAFSDIANELYGETGPTGNGGTWTPNDWWARDTHGKMLLSPGYPTSATINITRFVTPDAQGERYPEWFAEWNMEQFFDPVPGIDIWFSDNAFYRPRVDADWNRDGKMDSRYDPRVGHWLRQGMADYWAEIHRLRPGMPIMGNVDGGFDSHHEMEGFLTDPEYDGKINGALMESNMGRNFSLERRWGWDGMMEGYRALKRHTAAPHLIVFDVKLTPDGRILLPKDERAGYGGGAPYAAARYAFASALMDDGYFSAEGNGYNEAAADWFDEYDLAGAARTDWLGAAIDPPPTKPYQNGVYLRRFQNGAALVNPRSNPGTSANDRTEVDVTLPASLGHFKRFLGKQDPSINNGKELPLDAHGVPHLVIRAGDGIILVRASAP